MNQQYDIKASSFLFWWMACAVVVWPLALFLTGLMMFVLSTVVSAMGLAMTAPGAGSLRLVYEIGVGLFMTTLVGGIIGFSVGHLQRSLLQTRLYWVAENWRFWSAAGGILGGIVCGLLLVINPAFVFDFQADGMLLVLLMPFFMAAVSALQWRSLRHVVDHAWLWVLSNVAGGMIFAGLILMNQPPTYTVNYSLGIIGLWLLATLAQGLVTGFIMLHLFETHLLPMETGHPDEPVKNEEPSIWDRAI